MRFGKAKKERGSICNPTGGSEWQKERLEKKFLAITLSGESIKVSTYYPEPKQIETKREGNCMYRRK